MRTEFYSANRNVPHFCRSDCSVLFLSASCFRLLSMTAPTSSGSRSLPVCEDGILPRKDIRRILKLLNKESLGQKRKGVMKTTDLGANASFATNPQVQHTSSHTQTYRYTSREEHDSCHAGRGALHLPGPPCWVGPGSDLPHEHLLVRGKRVGAGYQLHHLHQDLPSRPRSRQVRLLPPYSAPLAFERCTSIP